MRRWRRLAQLAENFHARHFGHLIVDQDHIIGLFLYERQGGKPIGDLLALDSLGSQDQAAERSDPRLAIDRKNGMDFAGWSFVLPNTAVGLPIPRPCTNA